MDAAHEIEISVGEKKRHEFALFHTDAVLAGERPADFHAIADDLGGGFEGAFELRGIPGIVEDDGVQVAVAGVENIADLKAVLLADLLDAAQRLRKFRTRNNAVENVIAGSKAAERAESVFAAFPEEFAFGRVAGDTNFTGAMRVANFSDGGGLRDHGFSEAFHLDEKDGGAVHGESGVDVVFDGAKGPAIEHFAGSGSDGAGGDVNDGVRRVIDGIEDGKKRFHGFGLARELHGDFRDESECAF